ncbi:hypothetical protein L3X38_023935 [Prunus dulcis]|uniref:Uncharacterized protein n=1 Tax=Prunus dulcis TaxID=3755 RepID=A0AAD4Z6I6_PRUDU|nr:hypothetical protein L3X38_023935 [Prunus dulcis]
MHDSRGNLLRRDNEEVSQRLQHHEGHRCELQAMWADDVEKLVNDRLQDLKIGGDFEDALCTEVDQVNSSPFAAKIKQATPPNRFSMPFFTHFKGDFDLESHLKHFKSVIILYKAGDALMCVGVFFCR